MSIQTKHLLTPLVLPDIEEVLRKNRDIRIPVCQAERILRKFGGPRRLVRLLRAIDPHKKTSRNASSIYRWLYPREKGGTGGVVPTRMMPVIMRAARLEGILLTPEDFYPGDIMVNIKDIE